MSEELLHEQTQTEAAVTMADLEEHFDDANPWNRVQDYMDKKTVLPAVPSAFLSARTDPFLLLL